MFVKARTKSESKYVGLMKACLKAMCSFAESLDGESAVQMRGESNEEGFKNIMELCEEKNDLALKCLYNLSLIAECRPILGDCGVIQRLLLLITNNDKLSWQILWSLCLFCREAINRGRLKSATGLEVSVVWFTVFVILIYIFNFFHHYYKNYEVKYNGYQVLKIIKFL